MENYKIKTEVEISETNIEEILDSSFEGGSNYWLMIQGKDITRISKKFNGQRNIVKLILSGASIPIYDYEEGIKLGELSLVDIINALQAMANGKDLNGKENSHLKWHFKNLIDGNDDAETNDVIVQIATMKEIVFG